MYLFIFEMFSIIINEMKNSYRFIQLISLFT